MADGMGSTAASNRVVYSQRPPPRHGTSQSPPSQRFIPPLHSSLLPISPAPSPPGLSLSFPSFSSAARLRRSSRLTHRLFHHLVILPPPNITILCAHATAIGRPHTHALPASGTSPLLPVLRVGSAEQGEDVRTLGLCRERPPRWSGGDPAYAPG